MLKITKGEYYDAGLRAEHGLSATYLVVQKDDETEKLGENFYRIYNVMRGSRSINSKIFLSMIKQSFTKLGCPRGLLKIQKNYYDYFFEIISELSAQVTQSYAPFFDTKFDLIEEFERILKEYSQIDKNKKIK